jgi:hypothetical protein
MNLNFKPVFCIGHFAGMFFFGALFSICPFLAPKGRGGGVPRRASRAALFGTLVLLQREELGGDAVLGDNLDQHAVARVNVALR